MSTVTITEKNQDFKFDTLYLAKIILANKGNRDFEKFSFGVTLAKNDLAVRAIATSSDRHHELQSAVWPSPASPQNVIDFTTLPFNRGDTYPISIFITTPAGTEPGKVQVSSPEPVKFVDVPTVSEQLGRVVTEAASISVKFPI